MGGGQGRLSRGGRWDLKKLDQLDDEGKKGKEFQAEGTTKAKILLQKGTGSFEKQQGGHSDWSRVIEVESGGR